MPGRESHLIAGNMSTTSRVVDVSSPCEAISTITLDVAPKGASANSNAIALVTVPAAPLATAATGTAATTFTANWSASAGAGSYRLDVSTDGGFAAGSFVAGFEDRDVGAGTSAPVDGLTPHASYHYRVRARNENGTSADSNTVDVLTTPAPPVATAATAVTAASFTANWVGSYGATCYQLDVAADPGFVAMLPGQCDRDVGSGTSATVGGLAAGRSYYYRIRASSGTCASPCSNVIEAQTNGAAIPALNLAGLLLLAVLVALLGSAALGRGECLWR